jgi:hypothetical protein
LVVVGDRGGDRDEQKRWTKNMEGLLCFLRLKPAFSIFNPNKTKLHHNTIRDQHSFSSCINTR